MQHECGGLRHSTLALGLPKMQLTLRLLTLYMYHAYCNARDPNVIYIYHVDF